jgi:hypothetical protein
MQKTDAQCNMQRATDAPSVALHRALLKGISKCFRENKINTIPTLFNCGKENF